MRLRRPLWLALAFLFWAAACSSAAPQGAALSTPSATPTLPLLTPFRSPIPSPTPTHPALPFRPTSAVPTPTPFVHRIQKGDTLLGIALQYGVSVEDLQEANPALNPNLMPIGATVVIPLSKENPAGLPTPTPVPLPLGVPYCYPQADGGAWCLVAVRNPGDTPVESLSGWLMGKGVEEALMSPLNLLPPHERTVMAAYVPRWPGEAPRVFVNTALAVDPKEVEQRYVSVSVTVQRQFPSQGRVVTLEGLVRWPAGQKPREIWLAGWGEDAQGRPTAWRRWVLTPPQDGAAMIPFKVTLYALGAPIATVHLRAEGLR